MMAGLDRYALMNAGDLGPDPRELEPSISMELGQVMQKAIAKEAKDRFQTVGAFHSALELAMVVADEVTKEDMKESAAVSSG